MTIADTRRQDVRAGPAISATSQFPSLLFQKGLRLGRVSENRSADLAQPSFTSLEPAELHFGRHTCSETSLNPRHGQGDVLLIRLSVNHQAPFHTHVSVRGVDHDRVKRDALLRQADRKLEVRLVGGMVEVHRNRNRGAVRPVSSDGVTPCVASDLQIQTKL